MTKRTSERSIRNIIPEGASKNWFRSARIVLSLGALLVWASVAWAAAASLTTSRTGGLMGGTYSDANGSANASYGTTSTWAYAEGSITANDPSATKAIEGGAYDYNACIGDIEATRGNGKWAVALTAMMEVRVRGHMPNGFANVVEHVSTAKLLVYGNLNADGWAAREVRCSNQQPPGDYAVTVTVEGQPHTLANAGTGFGVAVWPATTDESRVVSISFSSERMAPDVGFSYQSVAYTSTRLDFAAPCSASVSGAASQLSFSAAIWSGTAKAYKKVSGQWFLDTTFTLN